MTEKERRTDRFIHDVGAALFAAHKVRYAGWTDDGNYEMILRHRETDTLTRVTVDTTYTLPATASGTDNH